MTDQHDVPALIAELRRLEAGATSAPWHRMMRDPEYPGDAGGYDVSAIDEHGDFMIANLGGDYPEIGHNRNLIAAMRNALPMLLDIAERYQRLECAVREEADANADEAARTNLSEDRRHSARRMAVRLHSLVAVAPPCPHERALTEYKAQAEKLLCDAAESADPAGLLRAADMVPAQALRDLLARRYWGVGPVAAIRALLPENAEATP